MVTLASIEAATARIRGEIYVSPLVHSKALSALSGNDIYLKLDNLQMTGSFKERGALNRILTLTDTEKARGVVAASAGNHGQAVAYHATRRGIRAQIWMPRYTPLVKLSATRNYGGDVVLHGNSYDEAYEGAAAQDALAPADYAAVAEAAGFARPAAACARPRRCAALRWPAVPAGRPTSARRSSRPR